MTTSIDGPECPHGHCLFDPTPCPKCQPRSERERLLDRLFGNPNVKVVNFKIDRGDRPASAEEICRQINGALDELEAGSLPLTDDFQEDDA